MKKNLFSNLIDYNNELEKIIEHKDFSERVKNLLLNMLYKIETSYPDYQKTKVVVPEKWEYCEEILEDIETHCRKIEILKPKSADDIKTKEAIINKDDKKIKTYQNEKQILKAILKISQNEVIINEKYYMAKEPLEDFFEKLNIDNKLEVIRDFDGWNWYRYRNEISNLILNLIYQNLLILVGNKEIEKIIKNKNRNFDSILNIKSKLSTMYNKQLSEEIINTMILIICQIYYAENIEKITQEKEILQTEKEKTVDREKFLEGLSTSKKQKFKEIHRIEDICLDKKLLEKEFIKRNKEGQVLFSINTLVLILEKEKEKLKEEIDEISEKMNPKKFSQRESDLTDKINLLNNIQNTKIEDNLISLQKQFIEALNIKLKRIDTKKEIIELLYIVRYYNLLEIENKKIICEEKNLNIDLNSFINKVIIKAFELKAINQICSDLNTNLKIYMEILKLKVIDLENIDAIIEKNGTNYLLSIHDDESIEYTLELNKLQIQGVKLNKKIKLFN